MPVSDSASLVARFLKANHYTETLNAFIHEAGLPEDAGSLNPGDWTIEQILQEKRQFDASLAYQKTDDTTTKSWTVNAPSRSHKPALSINSNVLCVHGDEKENTISVTCADRSLTFVAGQAPFAPVEQGTFINDSPILSIKTAGDVTLSTGMSGHLHVRNRSSRQLLQECRHHLKYAVQVASFREDNVWVVATAGWDSKILLYTPKMSGEDIDVGDPSHSEILPTNPESMFFVRHPDTRDLYLIASRRDSTHLYYYRIMLSPEKVEFVANGRQNLAPNSNAWIAFTPCCLSQCPGDPTLIAVATSHIPHMKLIIVRLLFPNAEDVTGQLTHANQASLARAELARQDREDTAIKLHVTTLAPQTPYSTPQVVWRPDGTGLFVNGDDGVIRGIEATSGKIIVQLKGHETGSKVRTLWAGRMRQKGNDAAEEILVSGGFDKKLLIWTI